MNHNFVVVHSLIAPVILEVDFLQKYKLVLGFTSNPVSINLKSVYEREAFPKSMKPLVDSYKKTRICAVEAYDEPVGEAIESCAIPLFGKATLPTYDVPKCTNKLLLAVLEQHKELFSTTSGHNELAEHFSPTTETPSRLNKWLEY